MGRAFGPGERGTARTGSLALPLRSVYLTGLASAVKSKSGHRGARPARRDPPIAGGVSRPDMAPILESRHAAMIGLGARRGGASDVRSTTWCGLRRSARLRVSRRPKGVPVAVPRSAVRTAGSPRAASGRAALEEARRIWRRRSRLGHGARTSFQLLRGAYRALFRQAPFDTMGRVASGSTGSLGPAAWKRSLRSVGGRGRLPWSTSSWVLVSPRPVPGRTGSPSGRADPPARLRRSRRSFDRLSICWTR